MRRKKKRPGTRRQTLTIVAQNPQTERLCAMLERVDRTLRRAEAQPLLLTPDEVAKCLRVSRRKVYRLIQLQVLQAIIVGTVMRVHPDDLDDFYRRQRYLGRDPQEAGGSEIPGAAKA
jgi:excisionase family DNA binding protein